MVRQFFLISIVVHFVAAIFSTGYHHFDEHFQILEFMNMKAGGTPASALAWEYAEKLRPWFQPYYFLVQLKALNAIGITDPDVIAWLFRFESAVLGLTAVALLYKIVRQRFVYQNLDWLAALLFLTWYVPYEHVRTSSENYSTIFFLFGMAAIFLSQPRLMFGWEHDRLEIPKRAAATAGLFMAFSFLCRYQMGVAILFFFLWLMFSRQVRKRVLSSFLVFLAIGITFGAWLDVMGYREETFVPWNYFHANLIQGKAAEFSRDPFWFYITKPFARGVPPLSIALMIGTFLFWLRNPRNVLTWVTVPFFLVHTIISHKEVRFLNFVYALAPLMTYFSFREYFQQHDFSRKWWVRGLVIINAILLVVIMFRSPRKPVSFYSAVQDLKPQEIHLLEANNPFLNTGLIPHFYLPHLPKVSVINSVDEVRESYIFVEKNARLRQLFSEPRCELKFATLPKWVVASDSLSKLARKTRSWGLFFCKSSS